MKKPQKPRSRLRTNPDRTQFVLLIWEMELHGQTLLILFETNETKQETKKKKKKASGKMTFDQSNQMKKLLSFLVKSFSSLFTNLFSSHFKSLFIFFFQVLIYDRFDNIVSVINLFCKIDS